MMITCKHVCETASDYIEGPVSPWQRFLLLAHLVICKHCRRYLRHLRASIGVAARVPSLETTTEQEIDALVSRLINTQAD